MKNHHDHSNSYKKNISLELVYSFRALVHGGHDMENGSLQADMVLEEPKEPRVLHPDPKAEGDYVPH